MKQTKEFKNLTEDEIKNRISELKKELMKDNVHISSGTAPASPGKLKKNKKNIARLLTVLKQLKQKEAGSK